MTTPIYRYPLDGTGTSPDNLVVGEEHQLSNRVIRVVAPTYGGFYAEGVVVKDLISGVPLVKGVDYYFGELFEFPTGRYGKEIFGLIVVTKPNVSSISINYQALGGDYSYSMDAIIAMIDNLNLDTRPVEWGSIIGRPALFNPATHWHDVGDVYGFEYVVSALIDLRNAILTGDVASHDEIYRYIDRLALQQSNAVQQVANDLHAHVIDYSNPHQVTKAQVGLGLVQNYSTASQTDMNTGTSSTLYVTPNIVASYVSTQAVNPLNTHIARTDNPHSTTKAQIGLSNVQNYGVATQADMNAGTSDSLYLTPLKVATYVTNVAVNPMNAHIARTDNPHSTTKAQVGLGNVQNYGIATQGDMNAGTSDVLYLTPLKVATYVASAAVNPMNAHIANQSNPHNVTKAQVGLSLVQNFGMASQADAQAAVRDDLYMTPARVRNAIDAIVPIYFNFYKATLDEARAGARDDVYITPWENMVVLNERMTNYYTRGDVDFLINQAVQSSTTIYTSGQNSAYSYTSQLGTWNDNSNYFDVFPPSGKTMSNLAAFTASMSQIYFGGDVDSNDRLRCIWSAWSDRIRIWVQATEQNGTPAANWMAVWK